MGDNTDFRKLSLKVVAMETIWWAFLTALGVMFALVRSPVGLLALSSLAVVTGYAMLRPWKNRKPKP